MPNEPKKGNYTANREAIRLQHTSGLSGLDFIHSFAVFLVSFCFLAELHNQWAEPDSGSPDIGLSYLEPISINFLLLTV